MHILRSPFPFPQHPYSEVLGVVQDFWTFSPHDTFWDGILRDIAVCIQGTTSMY